MQDFCLLPLSIPGEDVSANKKSELFTDLWYDPAELLNSYFVVQ